MEEGQRRCKHTSSTIEAVFSAWSMQSGYKEEFIWVVESSFETSAYQDRF
jgi:hypothetical protein